MRRCEILLEKLNRKVLQDLKEEPRSILSSRSLRSSWFSILVLSATSRPSDGTAQLFRVSPPEAVVYLNGIIRSSDPHGNYRHRRKIVFRVGVGHNQWQ